MDPYILPADTHIGHVHLKVRDLQASLAFYRDSLGFQEKRQEERLAVLAADPSGPDHLYLLEQPGAVPKPPRTTGLYHVAIRFPDRRSLGRAFQRLLEQRWPFQGAADHLVSEALYLADPDGNGLELYRDRPRQQWPIRNGQVAMASDPLDLESLLRDAAQDPTPWSGIDPETDIGHVHLQVSDLGKAEAFYNGLLGLEVTQRDYPGALFLSAGGYHHHLGLNTWAGRGASPPPENAVGLHSFLLDIPDPDWRQSAIQRLQASGVEIETSHLSDRAHRVLVQDPDGNRVEI